MTGSIKAKKKVEGRVVADSFADWADDCLKDVRNSFAVAGVRCDGIRSKSLSWKIVV